ncbi:MAG TPA: DUF4367 domain-containing protein [Candidatus Saccharimonadia bacterium]|nr:DUF4367 domain-containing protein [Candidatus Saccharimonadia bacterium]
MNCPVCQTETATVKIGGRDYCAVCGTAAIPGAPSAPPAKRVSLDLSPRNRTNAASHPTAGRHAHPANELHARTKSAHLLDLRGAAPHPVEPAAVVHPAHHIPAESPGATTRGRHLAHFTDRFEKARQVNRSPHIQKFAGGRIVEEPNAQPEPPSQELPPLAATHHEAMTRLTPTPPAEPPKTHTGTGAPWRPHLGLSAGGSRTLATVTAVALMGGYIWLQNYPKLALQNASNKAGVTASLPTYLPSSYSLAGTNTSPGLITLNFSSPSSTEPLKIDQHRTTWDSSSLLDNFVAKTTDDYATVQGQGLTIYLFNNNHATWVNRGIWYSIEGASRLSREQILKIAYSL